MNRTWKNAVDSCDLLTIQYIMRRGLVQPCGNKTFKNRPLPYCPCILIYVYLQHIYNPHTQSFGDFCCSWMRQPLEDPEKAAYQLPTPMFNTWNSWSMSKSNHLELFLKLWLDKVRVLIRIVSLILFTCTLIEVKIRTSALSPAKYCDLLTFLSDPGWLRHLPFPWNWPARQLPLYRAPSAQTCQAEKKMTCKGCKYQVFKLKDEHNKNRMGQNDLVVVIAVV